MTLNECYSRSYREARAKFLDAVDAAGCESRESHAHPERGSGGEALAIDVARIGSADADAVLMLSSACHGVEGYCGSGIQIALLRDREFRARCADLGVAVVFVHALNPFGFSHLHRTTQENVDLNRNFHDFSGELPANPDYSEIHGLLVPDAWPPTLRNRLTIAAYVARHGLARFQAAVTRGQYTHRDGLFYGGTEPTWSNLAWRQVLRDHARRARRLSWIDFHTGLGPRGHGERIFACRDDPATLARAQRWWGKVTSFYDGSSASAFLTGLAFFAVYDECPQAEYTGIALEYGTVPVIETIASLRADQWLSNHPDAPEALARSIRKQILDAFYVDTDAWRKQVFDQAREASLQAVAGLAGRSS